VLGVGVVGSGGGRGGILPGLGRLLGMTRLGQLVVEESEEQRVMVVVVVVVGMSAQMPMEGLGCPLL
jgi:hypothetical protein